MQKKSYVCVGGYGLQYWGGIYKPDIAGNCNGLSICVLDHETERSRSIPAWRASATLVRWWCPRIKSTSTAPMRSMISAAWGVGAA